MSVAMLAGCSCSCNGDGDEDNPDGKVYYTITFKQEGQEDVIRKVEQGQYLSTQDIPVITGEAKKGHSVAWDVDDFTAISSDTVVNAIETPNVYTITLQCDKEENSKFSQKVTYGQAYAIEFKPIRLSHKLDETTPWLIVNEESGNEEQKALAKSGTWEIDSDVTIIPNWIRQPEVITIKNLQLENLPASVTEAYNCVNTVVGTTPAVAIDVPVGDDFIPFVPVKEGKIFSCFLDENGKFFTAQGFSSVQEGADIVLEAYFVEDSASQVAVTFLEDGQAPVSISFDKNTSFLASGQALPQIVGAPATGYRSVWDFDKYANLSSSLNVYVTNVYTNEFIVTFYNVTLENVPADVRSAYHALNGAVGVYTTATANKKLSDIGLIPTAENKTFACLLDAEGNYFDASTEVITSDARYSAHWVENDADKYVITFLKEGFAPLDRQVAQQVTMAQALQALADAGNYPTPPSPTVGYEGYWNVPDDFVIRANRNVYYAEKPLILTITYKFDVKVAQSDIELLGLVESEVTEGGNTVYVYTQKVGYGENLSVVENILDLEKSITGYRIGSATGEVLKIGKPCEYLQNMELFAIYDTSAEQPDNDNLWSQPK